MTEQLLLSLPSLPCLIENYSLNDGRGSRVSTGACYRTAAIDPRAAGAVEVSTCYNFKGNFTLYRVEWCTRINGTVEKEKERERREEGKENSCERT